MIKNGKLDFRIKQNQSKYAIFSTLTSVIWGNLDSNGIWHNKVTAAGRYAPAHLFVGHYNPSKNLLTKCSHWATLKS